MTVDERARAGLFLAMQYPVEVPGVSVSNFLRTAKTAIDGEAPKLRTWVKDVNAPCERSTSTRRSPSATSTRASPAARRSATRSLQLELLNPKFAVLDETDSGLDIDALKVVSEGVNRFAPGGQGRAADHALHADPALHQARLRARLRRRPDRRGGRPRAGRRSSRPRATTSTSRRRSDHAAPTRAGVDLLPDARRRRSARTSRSWSARLARRAAAGLPRQRQHLAEAAGRDRRDGRPPRAPQRQRRPRHAQLGAESTAAFEAARDKVAAFIGAPEPRRGRLHQERLRGPQPGGQHARLGDGPARSVGPGDEVVITEMEHHSNIVPWQLLTERTGATLRWFGLTDDGRLDLSNIDELITERTKVVSLTWVSNMLGTINPVAEIARPGARGRRAGRRRRLPGRPAAAGRRGRLGRRLPRLHRSQGRRPDRASACCGAAASCSTRCRRSSAVAR